MILTSSYVDFFIGWVARPLLPNETHIEVLYVESWPDLTGVENKRFPPIPLELKEPLVFLGAKEGFGLSLALLRSPWTSGSPHGPQGLSTR